MPSYPPRRIVKEWKQKEEYQTLHKNSESNEDQEIDILNLPSRKEVHKRRRRKKREKRVENQTDITLTQIEEQGGEDLTNLPPKRRSKKKAFPLVNLLFILFFILVLIVSTYPFWVDKL